jgi:hypothetical protein
MKINIIAVIMMILALSLAACSAGNAATSTQAQSTQASTTGLSTGQLIAGTFKLEGTANAVTQAQAKELVTLWQAFKEVNTSGTSAKEEKAALLQQIQDTMTSEQISSIQAMGITNDDILTLADEKGVSTSSGSSASSNTTSSNKTSSSSSNGGPGGGPGGGGMDMAGGGPGGDMGGGAAPSTSSTQATVKQASQNSSAITTELLVSLVDPLTEALNKIVSA